MAYSRCSTFFKLKYVFDFPNDTAVVIYLAELVFINNIHMVGMVVEAPTIIC